MEIGRTKLIEDLGYTYAGLERDGYLSPVTELTIKYKASMRYGQKATVRTWVESHGKLRSVYGYEIVHEDGTLAAVAQSEHVLVKKDSFRPVSLSKVDAEWDATYQKIAKKQV